MARKKKLEVLVPRAKSELDAQMLETLTLEVQIEAFEDEETTRKAAIEKEIAEKKDPLLLREEALAIGIFRYATAHWDELAPDEKTRTVTLVAGRLLKRVNPPSVGGVTKETEGEIVEFLQSIGRGDNDLVRVRREVDKEAVEKALKTDPEFAEKAKGMLRLVQDEVFKIWNEKTIKTLEVTKTEKGEKVTRKAPRKQKRQIAV